MKKVMLTLTLFFVCLSFKVVSANFEEIKLISPALSEDQQIVLITDDYFDISWKKDEKTEKYIVYSYDKDYNLKTYELNNGETSYRIKNIDYGYYSLFVEGYDKNNEFKSESSFTLYRANKESKKIIIKNPVKGSVILDKYTSTLRVIWNMLYDADDYRITFYHGDKLLEETTSFTYHSYIKDDFIDPELK